MTFSKAALVAWARQPTSIAALATLAGVGTALALHQVSVDAAISIAVGALVGLALPDNSTARTGALRLAADALAVARAPSALTVGNLVNDMVGFAVAVEQPSGAVATVAVSAPTAEAAGPAIAEAVAVAGAAAEAQALK